MIMVTLLNQELMDYLKICKLLKQNQNAIRNKGEIYEERRNKEIFCKR